VKSIRDSYPIHPFQTLWISMGAKAISCSALLCLFATVIALAQHERVPSQVYEWKDLQVVQNRSGEVRNILKGYTDGFEILQIHTSTVEPGVATEEQVHQELEELIIIKAGTLEQTLNGETQILKPGSVTLVLPGDAHRIHNLGEIPATYYILRWRTKPADRPDIPSASSTMVSWDDVKFTPSAKGGRRNIMRRPTAMMKEFEMHVTTLDEGMKSHDPHTHVAEEILLIRYGQVEEMIDGHPYTAGPGSVIFLGSNVPHGVRNIGNGPCEYYAFQWRLR
jgi:(S)-ureidoglycine aminohydrolase